MRWTSREVATGAPSIGEIVWAGAEADQGASKAAARPTRARALLAGRAIRFMVVLPANSRGSSTAALVMRKTVARFIFRLLLCVDWRAAKRTQPGWRPIRSMSWLLPL